MLPILHWKKKKRLFVTLLGIICQDQQPRRAKKVKLVLEDILVSRDTKVVILGWNWFCLTPTDFS
jgi:hypothetical protein